MKFMNKNETNEIINKLIYELKLHDSQITGLVINNDQIEFEISCKGMNINYYYPDLDNVIFKISCSKTIETIINFYSPILVNDFSIEYKNYKYILKTDNSDFYIECHDINVEYELIKSYDKNFKKLDEFLKSIK